tara:strand:- start:364 stop:504 length:141 start_codon:yes stop_codon:yes gene_type:complete
MTFAMADVYPLQSRFIHRTGEVDNGIVGNATAASGNGRKKGTGSRH